MPMFFSLVTRPSHILLLLATTALQHPVFYGDRVPYLRQPTLPFRRQERRGKPAAFDTRKQSQCPGNYTWH